MLLRPALTTDGVPGPADWVAWYERYLLAAARRSARVLELSQEVMAAVASGDLPPTAVQDLLASFAQVRGAMYAQELADLSAAFVAGLMELGTTSAVELADSLTPGLAVPAPPPAPSFDGTDWVGWWRALTDHATAQATAVVGAYQGVLEEVAAGRRPPDELQGAANRYLERRLPDQLRRLLELCLDLLEGLDDVRGRAGEEYLEGVLATRRGADEPAGFALELEGFLDDTVTATLTVDNEHAEASEIRCSLGDLRRADGVGPAFVPTALVDPPVAVVDPGASLVVRISVALDAARYEPGPVYVGSLVVSGHDARVLEVPLRLRAMVA